MQTQTLKTAQDLMSEVESWLQRSFNYISLENAEKVLDNMLFEHIESQRGEDSAQDFINEYGFQEEYKESHHDNVLEFVEDEYEDEYHEYCESDNYPMWSTLFEFRHNPTSEVLAAARSAGLRIIDSNDSYNIMLFVSGAGYSFYVQHWIPMYLALPWVDAEQFEGIDYSAL